MDMDDGTDKVRIFSAGGMSICGSDFNDSNGFDKFGETFTEAFFSLNLVILMTLRKTFAGLVV